MDDKGKENEGFYLDNVLDYSVTSLETDSSDINEDNDIIPEKRRHILKLQVGNSKSDENEALCLDYLSDCSVISSETDDSDSNEDSGIIPNKFCQVILTSQDSDSENNGANNANDANDAKDETEKWSIYDKTITIEPFKGICGMKIMPKSKENIKDIVDLFIGDDFFEHMLKESNRYHYEIVTKYKKASKTKIWKDITLPEIKKFIGLIVLMGQVKKDTIYDYWSTDISIETPFFSKIMSRNRFQQIMRSWHFCNNENISPNCTNKLVKVQPVIDHLKKRFNDVYQPCQQLLLDESIIPCRGKLSLKTYNPKKLTKYGILVRELCEASTGYICNFEMYADQTKKIEKDISTIIKPYKNMWHHVYHDSYCNSINSAEILLKDKVRICGIIRRNRDLPKCLKKVQVLPGETIFRRKNNVLLQIWNNGKQKVNMISTIHSARLIQSSSTDRKLAVTVKKPKSIIDYSKYIKLVDRANNYWSYYSILRNTKKWTNRVVMFLINCALFNAYRVYTTLMTKKILYKKFLHKVSLLWITDSPSTNFETNEVESLFGISNISEPTIRTPRFDSQERFSNIKNHKLGKIVSRTGSKNPQRHCKVCVSNGKRSRTCFVCTFCNVPLHKGDCYLRYHTAVKY